MIIARDLLKEHARMKTLLPPGWPRPKGYSNGIAAQRPDRSSPPASSAGTSRSISPRNTLAGQFAQALRNIARHPRRGRRRARSISSA